LPSAKKRGKLPGKAPSEKSETIKNNTANPTWGDIFECCFKAQSSKLERLFSLKRGKKDVQALSFELSKISPQSGIGCTFSTKILSISKRFAIYLKFSFGIFGSKMRGKGLCGLPNKEIHVSR